MRTTLLLLMALATHPGLMQEPVRDRVPPHVAGTAAITGRVSVMGARSSLPIRHARVTLTSDVLPQSRTVDTEADGRFTFDGLAPGVYRVTAAKPGFVTLGYGSRRASDPPAGIDVTTVRVTADLALPRGAALEGTLSNEDGEPLQDVVVSALRFTHTPAGRRAVIVGQTRTDDLGRYRVHSLAAGDYYIDAAPDPLQALSQLSPPGPRPPGLARTYLPGSPRVQDARRVTLAAGQELDGLDFALTGVPLARAGGQVLDQSGRPAAVRGVRMQPVGGAPGDVRGTLQGHRFMFENVPPGDYWLTGVAGAPDAEPEFAAMRVTIAGQDALDITIATTKGAALDGKVEVEGVESRLPPGLRLSAIETEFELPGGRQPTPGADTQIAADGHVVVNGLFGPRLLRVGGLPATWALKGVWLEDAEVTDVPVDFKAGTAPRPLRVVLTSKTASVMGTVADGRNRPFANAAIVVFGADERRWGAASRFVKVVRSDGSGHFAVRGLLPGSYLAVALETLEDGDSDDPEVLRRLRQTATAVSLTESDEQSLSLKIRSAS